MKLNNLVLTIVLVMAANPSWGAQLAPTTRPPAPSIIFDTDISSDVDDALALAMLHNLHSRGACRLLAITISKENEYAAAYVDAVNHFYGHTNIPIGVVTNGFKIPVSKYTGLANTLDQGQLRYPHRLIRASDAPEATRVLRQVLADQPDQSVTIIQVGIFSNLARLLDSPGDAISPLDGRALVKCKVKLLSLMAGAFQSINGNNRFKEANIIRVIPEARKVALEWPTPAVWSGYEIGIAVPYPAISIEQDFRYVPHHPIEEAYRLYNPPPHERPTWDLTSVLYAIYPERGYFDLSSEGMVTVDAEGATSFTPAAKGLHRYLRMNAEQVVRVKEALVQLTSQPPAQGQ